VIRNRGSAIRARFFAGWDRCAWVRRRQSKQFPANAAVAGDFGNSGRNVVAALRRPGFRPCSLKDTTITEGKNPEFRREVHNAFDPANLSGFIDTLTSLATYSSARPICAQRLREIQVLGASNRVKTTGARRLPTTVILYSFALQKYWRESSQLNEASLSSPSLVVASEGGVFSDPRKRELVCFLLTGSRRPFSAAY